MSDGYPTDYYFDRESALSEIEQWNKGRENNLEVFTFHFGPSSGASVVSGIADRLGGNYFKSHTGDDLKDSFGKIGAISYDDIAFAVAAGSSQERIALFIPILISIFITFGYVMLLQQFAEALIWIIVMTAPVAISVVLYTICRNMNILTPEYEGALCVLIISSHCCWIYYQLQHVRLAASSFKLGTNVYLHFPSTSFVQVRHVILNTIVQAYAYSSLFLSTQ